MAGNPLPSTLSGNQYKNSLFAYLDKQKNTSKRGFVHRLVYVATTSPTLRSEYERGAIAEYYQQFLSKFQKNTLPQTEGVTGLLLLYPTCVIHLLESSSDVLTLILKDLSDMEERPNSLLQQARILVKSHFILNPLFPTWDYRLVTPPLSLQDSSPQSQPVETLVPDCLAMIYKLCVCLLKHGGSSSEQDFKKQALVLQEDTVIQLCQNPALQSPSAFLHTYTRPTDVLMDSEIVWPTHRRLYWS